jgi:hypothetical protein
MSPNFYPAFIRKNLYDFVTSLLPNGAHFRFSVRISSSNRDHILILLSTLSLISISWFIHPFIRPLVTKSYRKVPKISFPPFFTSKSASESEYRCRYTPPYQSKLRSEDSDNTHKSPGDYPPGRFAAFPPGRPRGRQRRANCPALLPTCSAT